MSQALTAHTAKKRFGQNFLHDGQVIERIVRAIHPQPTDTMVEIGPGQGALTAPLLAKLDRLHAIELDRDVIPHLMQRCGEHADHDAQDRSEQYGGQHRS